MPNVITHGLMAHEVVQLLDESFVADAIAAYPRLFFFGSNGPDFLFYYRFMSKDEEAREMRELGSLFHDDHINEFYTVGKELVKHFEEPYKSMTLSYLAGHLCHWALDSLAHPYVFHKTGLIEGDTRYDHYRMEAMIDTLVVKRIRQDKYREIPSYNFVKLTKNERNLVAKVYQNIIRFTEKKEVDYKKIERAIHSMYRYNLLLWDKTGLKTKIIQKIEDKIIKDPWVFSSHFVVPQLDLEHDILNLRKQEWSHPVNPEQVYTSSFMDLFNQSLIRGSHALSLLNQDIHQDEDSLEAFIDHRNYTTGLQEVADLKHFNLIYKH